nr:MAG TPA: terminase large subunit [Caudoviricetes sp.]
MMCQENKHIKDIISTAFYGPFWDIEDGKVQEFVAKGGRGSTKSSFIGVEVILQLRAHPQCHAAVFRRVANTLRTSVYAQIVWAINELGLHDYFRCTVSPMECTYLPTGQKVLFFGMDDPGKVKSIKMPFGYIGIAWFEELDQFDGEEQIRNVEQSCLRGGDWFITFKSFNPPAMARNWANGYALKTRDGKLVHHSTYKTTPVEWLGERFLADAEYLEKTNETAYRHEYLGEVVGSGTAVFENLRIEKITDEQIASFDRIKRGVDWGWYPDPWAYNAMHYDAARRVLYIFDELTRRRTANRDTAQLLLDRGLTREDKVCADSAEPKSIADYNKYGVKTFAARKGPKSVKYGTKWLQSLAAIVIDPERCPDTAKEFSEYEYERDAKTGEVLEGYPDINNHHIDAVRYAMESTAGKAGDTAEKPYKSIFAQGW